MRFTQLALLTSVAIAATLPAAASSANARKTTSPRSFKRTAAKPKLPAKHTVIGQRAIDDARATEIQSALAKAGYLTGTPSGHWDAASEAAMGKLQGDNGWQTKLVPDSRALIKLGLGPASASASPNAAPSAIPARP